MLRVSRLTLACASMAMTIGASAAETAPADVIVTMQSRGRVRVQVSEGHTMPCDSSDNRMLFAGTLGPDEHVKTTIQGQCVCVRNTTDSFPQGEWTPSRLVCRPRHCVGKRCSPAADQTIRVKLTAVTSP